MNLSTIYRGSIGVRARAHEERRAKKRPSFIAPMLCKRVQQLPGLADCFYEVKYDGYRAIAIKDGSSVSILSRSGQPLDYPQAREAVLRLKVKRAVIDCELVALVDGKPSVEALSEAKRRRDIRLYAFDLVYLNGRNLLGEAIERRKEWLCTITIDSSILFCPALDCEPDFLIQQVKRLRLPGIVAKQRGSVYEPGERTGMWVKVDVNAETRICERLRSWDSMQNVLYQGPGSGRRTSAAGRCTSGVLSRASQ